VIYAVAAVALLLLSACIMLVLMLQHERQGVALLRRRVKFMESLHEMLRVSEEQERQPMGRV
jgi:hypothetical protein